MLLYVKYYQKKGILMEKYKDEYGFFLDIDELLNDEEYLKMDLLSKNSLLLNTIYNNNDLLDSINTPVNSNEFEILKKSSEGDTIKPKKKAVTLSLDSKRRIDDTCSMEEFVNGLPSEDDILYQNKLARIKCELRLNIDIYDNFICTTDDEEMIDYLQECKELAQEKLGFILSIEDGKKEQVVLEKQEKIDIFYFSYNGTNLIISDLLKEDTEKYESYLVLLDSILNQTFKGIKKITKKFCSLYQIRCCKQRLVFDYIDKDKIIIIIAFTKKVQMDKKYRETTEERFEKYISEKDKIIKRMREYPDEFLEEGSRDNIAINELLKNKNKVLAKRGRNGKNI